MSSETASFWSSSDSDSEWKGRRREEEEGVKRGEGPTKEWERLWMTSGGGGAEESVKGPKTSLKSKS